MSDRVNIPKEVEDKIGYKSWTALSWFLHNGWVKDYKWYFSEIAKQDIGVPATIHTMMSLCDLMSATGQFYTYSEEPRRGPLCKVGTRGLLMWAKRIEPKHAVEFYKLTIGGYLLGTDFVSSTRTIEDEDGANQLEGELKRHWASKNGILTPRDVCVTPVVVDDYCTTYHLDEMRERFSEKLRL